VQKKRLGSVDMRLAQQSENYKNIRFQQLQKDNEKSTLQSVG
jgi:hypothetical protein